MPERTQTTHPTGSTSPTPTVADWQTTHEQHCNRCHTLTKTTAGRRAANAASEARRDRRDLQLNLNEWRRTATLWGIPVEAPRV